MFSKHALNVTKLSSVVNTRWIRQIQSAAKGSYLHNPGSEPLVYDTLSDVIAQTVDRYPGRVAVKSLHENITITYEELLRQVLYTIIVNILQKIDLPEYMPQFMADSLGCALRAQGLEKGDRLGIWSHNSVSWVVAVVAAARAGLISVLINPVYEKKELAFCIKKTQMKGLIIGDSLPNRSYYETLSQLVPELRNNKAGAWTSKEFPSLISIISSGKDVLPGTSTYSSLITGQGSQISQYGSGVKSSDGCLIHFTSGTTGDPKAALDSHLGVVNNTYFTGKRNGFHEEHAKICVQVPLFHALGSIVTCLGSIRHGGSLILPNSTYNVDDNIKALFGEQCTAITGTPTMYVDMLTKVTTMGDVGSKVRMAMAAGAPCSPQLIRDMQTYLKAQYVKGLYGMTEVTACIFQSLDEDSIEKVAETVGYITDHVETKVVDDNGDIVPFGSPGELMVRGYNNMICYWDEPKKTRETLAEDGWLRTGDKFTISEDGYGKVVGRLKDIIVRGGENIAPKEIEDLLNTHPDIVESQVVGLRDERLGEELCAVLRLREGAPKVTLDDVRKHCSGHIARFKIPRIVKIADEFPKTASGKIQKYRLKEIIETGKL